MAKIVENNKEYRKFGISVGIAFLLLAALFWWKDVHNAMRVTGALGAVLLLGGLIAPGALKWPYRGWMKFATVMNWFTTRLILTLLFSLAIAPMGLLMRILGKRPLAMEFDKEADSYWIRRERKEYDPVRSEKHF